MDLISQRFGLPMYWSLYFLNLGLVFTLKCSITIFISFVFHVANEECKYMSFVLLHVDLVYRRFWLPMMDWGLYFPILGLVFDVKGSIIIPISFVFHVAHEECKYISPLLREVDLISKRSGFGCLCIGVYISLTWV